MILALATVIFDPSQNEAARRDWLIQARAAVYARAAAEPEIADATTVSIGDGRVDMTFEAALGDISRRARMRDFGDRCEQARLGYPGDLPASLPFSYRGEA